MDSTGIIAAICTYLNARVSGVPFIQAPNNGPAPKGLYIAVAIDSVRPEGMLGHTTPGTGCDRFISVATVSLTEVEGNGDTLRHALQMMRRAEFLEFAADHHFTIWNDGSTFPVDTYDGEFYVRQWKGTIEANFVDEMEETEKATIQKVTGSLNSESIDVQRVAAGDGTVLTTAPESDSENSLEVSL